MKIFIRTIESFMKSYAINDKDAGLLFEIAIMHYAMQDVEESMRFCYQPLIMILIICGIICF